MQKESKELGVTATDFNEVFQLTDKLRFLTRDRDYAYSVRYHYPHKYFYIAKWLGNQEIPLVHTKTPTIEGLIGQMKTIVDVLEDYTELDKQLASEKEKDLQGLSDLFNDDEDDFRDD